MIGKQLTGKNFRGCIRYLLEKEQSAVLDANGIRDYDTKSIIEDFNAQRKLRPSLGKAVGHAVLSWSNEDRPKLTVEKMAAHAREYMEKMGITDTQYLVVLHTDRDHPHLHIVYNRVDNSGETISNYNLWEKNNKVCREMTERYGYHMGKGKEQVNRQALRGKEKVRYEIYDALKQAATKATSWRQLEKLLAKGGITIQYKYRSGTKEVQGISFEKDEVKFKGSAIDREFSHASLDRQLANNQGMGMDTGSMGQKQSLADQIRQVLDTHQERGHSHEPSHDHGLGLLDILLQPVYITPEPDPVADAEKRRRKRKKQEAEQSRGMGR